MMIKYQNWTGELTSVIFKDLRGYLNKIKISMAW